MFVSASFYQIDVVLIAHKQTVATRTRNTRRGICLVTIAQHHAVETAADKGCSTVVPFFCVNFHRCVSDSILPSLMQIMRRAQEAICSE